MAVTNSGLQTAWSPEDYGKLIDTVIAEKSIAFQSGTIITTGSESIRFPKITADPAVGWYAENSQITLTDPTTDELVVTPKAVKGLTQISNEAAEDSNPAVADQVGAVLARSIAKKIDAAFFANTTTNGPSGLLSLSGINVVDTGTGTPISTLHAFHDAKAAALADGANLTHFILAPDVALLLSKAWQDESNAWNAGFLDINGIQDGTTVAGVRVLISTDVPAGNAWGLDSSQVLIVQRTGTTIARSFDAAFSFDAVQVRGTARVSFGFANPLELSDCMTLPDADLLSTLSGLPIAEGEAGTAVALVAALARSNTRDNGWTDEGPTEDIAAVITTATLRLLTNPAQTTSESLGGLQVNFGANFLGWSITELMVLNRYRDRAR